MFCAKGQCVTLGWNPSPETSVVGYAVYYGIGSGAYTERIDAGDQTSVTITGLTVGVTYYFAVTAYTAIGTESLPSNEIAYTVPPPATNQLPRISAISLAPGGISLDWTTLLGHTYRVTFKDNLTDTTWNVASPDLVATNNSLRWVDSSAITNKQRFYSVVMLP